MNAPKYKRYIGIFGLGIALGTAYWLMHMRQAEMKANIFVMATSSEIVSPQAKIENISQPVAIKKSIAQASVQGTSATSPTTNSRGEMKNKPEEILSSQVKINTVDVQEIVVSHNTARSVVGAIPLSYSANLAQGAQEWADTLASANCDIRHAPASVRKGAGENIWYGSGYGTWNVRDMIQDWLGEKSDYNYENNTCATGTMCGHYTQIVWAKTTAVGCGIAACAQGEARIFVCRYSPAGNVIGQKPY